MYIFDNTTIDLYNDISSGFVDIIKFFPVINSEYIKQYGQLGEINYTYSITPNIFPLKRQIFLTEIIVLGLNEVRKQIHQNIKISELYNGENSGILFFLVKNWGPTGDNILSTECLNSLYKLMKYIQKKISLEVQMIKLVEELNLSQSDLDKLILNLDKINLAAKNVDDLTESLNKINLSSKTVNDITQRFRNI